ncbi:Alpha-L-fucosidase [Maioricimonas rarisocia]|uniref:alpha-L-fucosidase n=1 Tax=Maioricimonas rarisocia TaxID=2528026 RepID=A0A517ZAI0_9PLAN|nr:alpha-L-fucosidase [Maioricimonas rarisocia]QDU39503.1 Alpha-L-fucosidase [Maioricimonas rarisocia]
MFRITLSQLALLLSLIPLFAVHVPALSAEDTDRDPLAPHPAVAPAIERIDAVVSGGPFQPNWESLSGYEIPQWYRDAKFGIFIHWGAYSVPAFGSEWYPRQMYIDAVRRGDNFFEHHRETYGPQSEFGYKDFIPKFRAEKFDPEAWADLFVKAGAKYVVPVAEHHDGFPMYACSFTEWDASEMGPRRDVIDELQKAVRARGLKFGVSSHRAFNWKFYVRRPDYDNADPKYARLYGRPMPFLFREDAADYRKRFEPQDEQFKDDWLARTCELVDRFDPDLVWFDFGITASQETDYRDNHYSPWLQRFAAYYYNRSLKADGDIGIINYKWQAFPEDAAVLDLERSKMDAIRTPFWQTDTAVSSSSWGYTRNQNYKTPNRLVDDLVDIVSKNGCLLLNIGPRADGTIPEKDQEILLAIGRWLELNGEAIYGTTYWKTYGEGPTKTATGHLAEKKNKPFTAEDIRFTEKGGTLYAILLDWPEGESVTIRTLGMDSMHSPGKIESVEMIGVDAPLGWDQDADGLTVRLPKQKPCDFAYVLRIR